MLDKKIAIIGAGLMGISLYRSVQQKQITKELILLVKNDHQVHELAKLNIKATIDYNQLKTTNFIVIAAPLKAYEDIITNLISLSLKNVIVTDVGSVKAPIIELFANKAQDMNFVPAHPIAGSHKSGLGMLVENLYQDKKLIITTDPDTDGVDTVKLFWQKLGMKVEFMDALVHDKIYAYISHIVQKVAFNIKELFIRQDINLEQIKSDLNDEIFNKFIRLSDSNHALWDDIFFQNRKFISAAKNNFLSHIQEYTALVQDNRFDKIFAHLQNSKLIMGEKTSTYIKVKIEKDNFLYYMFAVIVALSLIKNIHNKKYFSYMGSGFFDIVQISKIITDKDALRFNKVKYKLLRLLRDFYSKFI